MKRKKIEGVDIVSVNTKKISDPVIALEKARGYCAYQERYQQEVRDKLYEWGLWPEIIEDIIAKLISENYLNEERFAIAFARGKFRIKRWGRVKIKIELRKRKISDYCINKAIKEIDPEEYDSVLQKAAIEKLKITKEKSEIKKKHKIIQYLLARGFEFDLVNDVLKTMLSAKK